MQATHQSIVIVALFIACVSQGRAQSVSGQRQRLARPALTSGAIVFQPERVFRSDEPVELVDTPDAWPAFPPARQCQCAGYGLLGIRPLGCCLHGWDVDPAEPFGAAMQAHFQTHVDNGRAAQLVLYHYDFHEVASPDAARLTDYGQRRLQRLVPLLEASPHPLIIQPVPGDPGLSEARRRYVLERVSSLVEIPFPQERVIVAQPPAAGLSGAEALRIDTEMLQRSSDQDGTSTLLPNAFPAATGR